MSHHQPALLALGLLAQIVSCQYSCDVESVEFQRAFSHCNGELEDLYQGDFYKDFLSSPEGEELETLCNTYIRWLACLKSLAATCNVEDQTRRRGFGTAHQLIIDTCVQRKQSTIHNLHCLMSQSREINPLYKGCYSLMELKHKAAIFNTCSIAQEYIECEDRLMRSACGSELADFSLALSLRHKFTILNLEENCIFTPSNSYKGFVYSMRCPPEFPVRMRKCYDAFLQTRVAQYPKMLAVVKGPVSHLDDWCSAFHDYEECMSPIATTCPEGVASVYATENEWYRLVQIAIYLCRNKLEDYKHHLPCYRRMLQHSSMFKICRTVFEKYPTKYEAYSIKCTADTPESQRSLQKRSQLINCFAVFIGRECGENASHTIEPLIHLQYSFDFLPPCGRPSSVLCQLLTSSAPHIYTLTSVYHHSIPLGHIFLSLIACYLQQIRVYQ